MFKIIIIAALLFIIFSLGVAFVAFVKKDADSDKMLKALTVRIGLSIVLIIIIMIGSQFGLISPHGI